MYGTLDITNKFPQSLGTSLNRRSTVFANEIPSELSRENMISSHVKITCCAVSFACVQTPPISFLAGCAHSEVFFNTRREIQYLQAAM